MGVIKIALTGGPSAGKTTIIEEIKRYVKKHTNYNLIVIPETATELSDNLIRPQDAKRAIDFQGSVLERQVFKEQEANNIIKYNEKENNLILCDRGVMDNWAYLNSHEEFDYLLDKHGLDEINILDDYDLVIYLESTSCYDNLNYETESNEARYEAKEEASVLDKKTLLCWCGHRNLKIVKAKENFTDKKNEVIDILKEFISGIRKSSFEMYEIDESSSDLTMYDDNNSITTSEYHYYLDLNDKNGYDYVLIKRIYKENESYVFVVKKTINKVVRIVHDKKVSQAEFLNLIAKYKIKKIIKKEVLSSIYDGFVYKIESYDDGKILVLCDENKGIIPNNIKVSRTLDGAGCYEQNKYKSKKIG